MTDCEHGYQAAGGSAWCPACDDYAMLVYAANTFRSRLDGELLIYAAKKLSEIRPEASLNREAGTTTANADGPRVPPSASSGLSGAEPRADTQKKRPPTISGGIQESPQPEG